VTVVEPLKAPRSHKRWVIGIVVTLVVVFGAVLGTQIYAEYHLRVARHAARRFRLREAERHLGKCLTIWPNNYRANLLAGQTARRLGDFSTAERYLYRCLELSGRSEDEVMLERALLRAQRGEMDQMQPFLRQLVENDHLSSVLILEAMARGYIRAFRYGEGGYMLDLWLEREPDDPQAQFLQGWVREQVGPRQQAVDNYQRVLELEPDHDQARLRLANLLLERARPREALTHLEILAANQPNDVAILVSLAQCQLNVAQVEAGRKTLKRVLDDKPKFGPALLARAELALLDRQPAEAETYLRRAIEVEPTSYQARFLLFQALQQQEKDTEAARVQQELSRLEADIRRINVLLTERLNKTPNDPALLTEMGQILLRSGAGTEGVRWLYRALGQNQGYRPAHSALASHFEKTGDRTRAAEHRRALAGE
jgi:tetratricopeptide (TPR) repeat protein